MIFYLIIKLYKRKIKKNQNKKGTNDSAEVRKYFDTDKRKRKKMRLK